MARWFLNQRPRSKEEAEARGYAWPNKVSESEVDLRKQAVRAAAEEAKKPFRTYRVDSSFGTVLEPPAWARVNQHLRRSR